MIIRFKYERGRELKYLAHLDMMTLFERALKRANIDVAFSNGFNKRPLLVFGMPISLGLISLAEYVDITLLKDMDPLEFQNRMNKTLPTGIKIIRVKKLGLQKNIMSDIAFAKYSVYISDPADLDKATTKLLSEKEIYVKKERKGRVFDKEIRKGIISADIKNNIIRLFMTSGQNENIKPEEFMEALQRYTGTDIEILEIIREEMYIKDDWGEAVSPFNGSGE